MLLVIIGIISVLAIPRFQAFYYIKLHSAAKVLISHLRYTQSLAIARHETYTVEFDAAAERYEVYRQSDEVFAKDPLTRNDLVVDFSTDSRFRGVDITSVDFAGSDVVSFNWEGVPLDENGTPLTSAGSVTIAYKGESLTIIVAPQTGRVTWQ